MTEGAAEMAVRVIDGFRKGLRKGDLGAIFDGGPMSPDFEWVPARELPDWRVYRGREGFAEFVRTWTDAFDDWEVEVEQATDTGPGRALVVMRQSATGHGSSTPVELRFAGIFEFEDALLRRITLYMDPDEAQRAAAGS